MTGSAEGSSVFHFPSRHGTVLEAQGQRNEGNGSRELAAKLLNSFSHFFLLQYF